MGECRNNNQSRLVILSWEFMKEYKKVNKKENTLLTKKATKKKEKKKRQRLRKKERIHAVDQEKRKENKNFTMKKKETRT